MKRMLLVVAVVALTGCSTVKEYWPRPHDPEMFGALVDMDIAVERVNCGAPDWTLAIDTATKLARFSEWRNDPQATNLKGLQSHTEHMSRGGSQMFCELGKNTAAQRIKAAKAAWEGR